MPPPPPNFFPATRRRQRLDPTRHLQGRELWNKVRFHSSATRYDNSNSSSDDSSCSSFFNLNNNNVKWAISLIQAIAYEIQPFRIKPTLHQIKVFICNEDDNGGLKQLATSIMEYITSIVSIIIQVFKLVYNNVKQMDVKSIIAFFTDNKSILTKLTFIIIGLRIYYHALLYLHDMLHIGPLVLIVTLLILFQGFQYQCKAMK